VTPAAPGPAGESFRRLAPLPNWIMRTSVILLSLLLPAAPLAGAPEYPRMGPDIFDREKPGEALVAAAIERAGKERKRILLFFGANWCPWCRRLHRVFATEPDLRELLREHFLVVHVDANFRREKDRNAALLERYGNPLRFGLPVFVLLEVDGRPLTTQETQSFAAPTDEEVACRLREFLETWIAAALPESAGH
jgi:thiol-disulfide isomerase/thioredoxin